MKRKTTNTNKKRMMMVGVAISTIGMGINISSGERSSFAYSSEQEDSLGISDEAPGMMPISKERHTLEQTDFRNNDDINDQKLLIKNYKEEKVIKLAIMDKLEQILDEKLRMLKAEKVKVCGMRLL